MEQVLTVILSWQFMIFSLSLAGITYVVRLFVEFYEKDVKDLMLWNSVILPVLPVLLGVVLGALVREYPYPVELNSAWGRAGFGLVAGLFSGFVFRVAKAFFNAKFKSHGGQEMAEDEMADKIRQTFNKDE